MYYLFILAIGAERLIEMVVSRRNANWSFANGGKEFGRGHFPVMVGMHTLLLVSCVVEVARAASPVHCHGWAGRWCGVVVLSTVMRWWCVAVLGKHWNPRLIVIPGAPLVRSRAVSLAASSQLHGGDRGGGGAAACAFGVADGDRVHHRQRPGAQRADPRRERRARLRVTMGRHRG